MDQPLGRTVGNTLELREAIEVLRTGTGEPRLAGGGRFALAEEALLLAEMAYHPSAARFMVRRALEGGAAAERFGRMVAALGGPADLMERPEHHLPAAPAVLPVLPARDGWVGAVDSRALGVAIIELGGGRARLDDRIDHRVGLADLAPIGTRVGGGRAPAVHGARGRRDERPARGRPGARRFRDGHLGAGAGAGGAGAGGLALGQLGEERGHREQQTGRVQRQRVAGGPEPSRPARQRGGCARLLAGRRR